MTHTNTTILARRDITPSALEFPDLEVPVLAGAQRQGDVLVVPADSTPAGDTKPIGAGIIVVRAETNQSNTHTLVGDGTWQANPDSSVIDLVEGWLTVPEDGEAFLIHTEEHNALGIAPGCYEVRRQREFAGEWALVTD